MKKAGGLLSARLCVIALFADEGQVDARIADGDGGGVSGRIGVGVNAGVVKLAGVALSGVQPPAVPAKGASEWVGAADQAQERVDDVSQQGGGIFLNALGNLPAHPRAYRHIQMGLAEARPAAGEGVKRAFYHGGDGDVDVDNFIDHGHHRAAPRLVAVWAFYLQVILAGRGEEGEVAVIAHHLGVDLVLVEMGWPGHPSAPSGQVGHAGHFGSGDDVLGGVLRVESEQ